MTQTGKHKYIVAIKCFVYNHEPFLRDCLDGFVMQQTTFPFTAIIHDDASTDASATIIREYAEKYPNIIRPIFQIENQYSKHDGSLRRILNAELEVVNAKYIALCEGDDHWIDPLKLQKQIDLLEQHPECSFCCGGYIQRQKGLKDLNIVINKSSNPFFKFTKKDWANKWFTMPLTIVYRYNLHHKYNELANQCRYTRDAHLIYSLLDSGDGIYLSEKLAVYNVHLGGISSMKKPYTKVVNAYKCYKELYQCTNDNILKEMYINNIILRIRSIEETNIKELIKEGLILSYKYWNNLFAAVLIHYTKRLVRKHTNKTIF